MAENQSEFIIKLILTTIYLSIFLIITYFLFSSAKIFSDFSPIEDILNSTTSIIPQILFVIILFFIFKFAYIIIIEIFLVKTRKFFLDGYRFRSILPLIKFCWWAIFMLVAISIIIKDIGTIVTSLGLVGLGLTFALQKPILNFVGWITIIVKNIFNEGDRIKVGNFTGDVKEIQLMNTVLQGVIEGSSTRSEKTISFPNELVLTQQVENFTKDSNYIRDELSISIIYESDIIKPLVS